MELNERVRVLEMSVQQLAGQLQETRNLLEQLAKQHKLVYSQDAKRWMDAERFKAILDETAKD